MIDGAAVETLVFELLRAKNADRDLGYELYFWRTSAGDEVDFVAYGERGLLAIEVKRSSRFREGDLAGLRLFCEEFPEARGFLLYGGSVSYRFGAIDVLPIRAVLTTLAETLANGNAK